MAAPLLVRNPFKSEQRVVRSKISSAPVVLPKRDELYQMGKSLLDKCPRKSHATWKAPANRPDAVELVLQAERGRMPELLPLRHGRMARSAFTFYRGAALTMACDLATTPTSGIRALAHARAGASNTLSGYMGKSDTFDQALAEFSVAYADQNERDHAAFEKAVRSGNVKAVFEESK